MAPSTRALREWTAPIAGGIVVAAVLAARFPAFMVHWDEFQLAYGVDAFDLARHQPHPPGYYLFLEPLTGDASRALMWVSALSLGALAASLSRWAASRLGGGSCCGVAAGAACAAWMLLSPLLSSYGSVGLTYAAEAAVWVALCAAVARRPRGKALWALALAIGFAGGLRPTLAIWGVALLALEALRHPGWISFRRAPALALAVCAGAIPWLGAMLLEAGGLSAYRDASSALVVGNIWEKSLFHTGAAGLRARAAMFLDLWAGLGPLLLLAPPLLAARIKGNLRGLDPLLAGGAIAFSFYAVLIYDTSGYMVAPSIDSRMMSA